MQCRLLVYFNPAVVERIHKGLKNPRLLDCEVELASGTTFVLLKF